MISLLVAKVNISVANISLEFGKYFITQIVFGMRSLTFYGLCGGFVSHAQFVAILESVLAKISRYDEGTLFSSFLSFTVRINNILLDD